MTVEYINLRDALKETVQQLASEGRYSKPAVIKEFRKRHSQKIKSAKNDLERIALMRVLDGVHSGKTKISAMVGQRDLFGEVSLPAMVSRKNENGMHEFGNIGSFSLEQLISIFSEEKKAETGSAKKKALDAFIELAKQTGSKKLTLDEARSKLGKKPG